MDVGVPPTAAVADGEAGAPNEEPPVEAPQQQQMVLAQLLLLDRLVNSREQEEDDQVTQSTSIQQRAAQAAPESPLRSPSIAVRAHDFPAPKAWAAADPAPGVDQSFIMHYGQYLNSNHELLLEETKNLSIVIEEKESSFLRQDVGDADADAEFRREIEVLKRTLNTMTKRLAEVEKQHADFLRAKEEGQDASTKEEGDDNLWVYGGVPSFLATPAASPGASFLIPGEGSQLNDLSILEDSGLGEMPAGHPTPGRSMITFRRAVENDGILLKTAANLLDQSVNTSIMADRADRNAKTARRFEILKALRKDADELECAARCRIEREIFFAQLSADAAAETARKTAAARIAATATQSAWANKNRVAAESAGARGGAPPPPPPGGAPPARTFAERANKIGTPARASQHQARGGIPSTGSAGAPTPGSKPGGWGGRFAGQADADPSGGRASLQSRSGTGGGGSEIPAQAPVRGASSLRTPVAAPEVRGAAGRTTTDSGTPSGASVDPGRPLTSARAVNRFGFSSSIQQPQFGPN